MRIRHLVSLSWATELSSKLFVFRNRTFTLLKYIDTISSGESKTNYDGQKYQTKPPPLSMTFVTSFWSDWRRQRKKSERLVSSQDLIICNRSGLLFLLISFLFPLTTVCLLRSLVWTSVRQSDNLSWSMIPSWRCMFSTTNDWLLFKVTLTL